MKYYHIIEAYIDDTGDLQDFEMSPEELSALELDDSLADLKQQFVNLGAKGIDLYYNPDAGSIHIYFSYINIMMYVRIKVDSNTAMAIKGFGSDNEIVFKGNSFDLAQNLGERGLDFLLSE
jgi:hypothetical protein